MPARKHRFAEGEMTIREFIKRFAPCLSDSTVRSHLRAGRNSAQAMLTFSPNCAKLGQRGRAVSPFARKA